MADTTRSSRAFAVCEQTVYTLEYVDGASPTNPAVVNRLWLTDPKSSAFQQGQLSCFAQASSNIPQGYSRFAAGSLFYLTGSSLVLADVSSSPNPEMVPRHLPLMGTPTRILYSARLCRLIVLYTTIELLSPGAPLSTGTTVQRRALHPAIAFVDPDAEPTRFDQGERAILNLLKADDAARGERFLGILEWFPTDGKKQYHMLVIHTVIGQAGSQEAMGRLLFFFPYLDDNKRIKQKIILDHEAEISAVATHGDSSLVYGCGNDILVRFLNLEEKKFKQTMKVTLRSPAVHISVQGVNIHVSTKSHGHHILSLSEDGLTARWAERTSRISAHHLIAPEESLVITTDFQCRVAGLWQPPRPQLDRTAPLIFEALLPRSITRLCRMPRPVWQKKQLEEEAILGTSEDGTIYQLSLLDEASWRLLAYIQNMVMREPRICPYPHPRVHERNIEPSMARKQNMHIDGDKLIRLLERGSRTLLEEMLAEDGTQDRRDRLSILATDALKGKKSNGDIVESVLGWIRSLLLPAI